MEKWPESVSLVYNTILQLDLLQQDGKVDCGPLVFQDFTALYHNPDLSSSYNQNPEESRKLFWHSK